MAPSATSHGLPRALIMPALYSYVGHWRHVIQIFASLGLLLTALGLSGGSWYFWDKIGDALIPAGRYLVLVGLMCAGAAPVVSYLRGHGWPSKETFADKRVWSVGLLAIFFSDWLVRPWGLFKGPTIRGELLVGGFICYLLLRKRRWIRFFSLWPAIVVGLLVWSFHVASKGALLFSDDHAMFLFRLRLLRENFPSIPFWSPLWNAGFDARDFFATGALNAYFLSAPLLYLFPAETVYPAIICGILWILAPASTYVASRLVGLPAIAAALSTTLSLCSGLFWFRWALKYGTVGFITSAALFPLVLALSVRFIKDTKPSIRSGAALCIVTSLMLLWSPSGIAALPILLVAIPQLPRLVRSKRHIIALAVLVALNLPWVCMMWKVSSVGRFLNSHTETLATPTPTTIRDSGSSLAAPPSLSSANATQYRHKSGSISFKKALGNWQNNATALNPIIVVLSVPALIVFSGIARSSIIAVCVWLFLLGTVGVSLKPQLELDRMIVIASIVICIPIGQYLAHLFATASRGLSWRLAASCTGAFMLIGPFAATSVVLNRSDDTYSFADKEVASLVRTLSSNAVGGRVVFSGCVLHQLSGGHLAPLPLWSQTPMVASSYAHNIWKYEQPIPEPLLSRGDPGIREFFDLMNASLVTAHEPTWIEYFKTRPAEYEQIWRGTEFFVFRRLNYSPSYTLRGELVDLTFTSSSISFTPASDSLVLKFRHFPFMQASSCKLRSEPSAAGFDLVSLSGCTPGTRVTIQSVSPARRLFGGA